MTFSDKDNNTFPLEGSIHGEFCFSYLPCINYAIYNNNVPTCLECSITNQDSQDWKDIAIKVEGTDTQELQIHLNQVSAGETVEINELNINPNVDKLIELTEAIYSSFKLSITCEGKIVFEKEFSIYLMAYDQWCGTTIMPELLSTFVIPNHPLISRVINNAAKHLEKFSGSSSFDEYQTQNPNRVRMQVAAIYEALREESLIYVSSPASFESYGQRVRLADKVLNEKLGTCLDLTLLFASCLEATGIHPILVLKKGHIFVGAWLIDSIYSLPVSDDISFLVKESSDGINEMVFVESTCLTSESSVSFDEASETARHSLLEGNDFNSFIDVARCRMDRIRPLPQRAFENGNWLIVNEGSAHELSTEEVKEYNHYDIKIEDDGKIVTKQQIWERKLLDFSLRNNLLNMKIGRKVIPFISYKIDKLEDYIQAGEHYQLLPSPFNKTLPVDEGGIYHSMLYKNELEEFITKELVDKKLHSYLKESELEAGIKHLYRESRTALEENGANSLFLVLGILKWFETSQSELPRFAPLLLLPVEIVRNGGCKKFVLRARDEEIILNITLVELLKQKYDIILPGLDPLPKDDSGVDVKKIFSVIRSCILHQKGWDVIEECMLGLFSFNKFVMWNDIHTNADKLKENAVIQGLMNNQSDWGTDKENIDASELDSITSPAEYALPVPADSSQLEAVLEAGEGKSFILHGPPGTGKSQTITNIIANALYHDKRVLFVAEKMAALSVVQNRLARIGLEPFCLELHSNKINKKHFLDQMDNTLNLTRLASPQDYASKADALFEQRKHLIAYMNSLHKVHDSGYSLCDCINGYTAITEQEISHNWRDIRALNKENVNLFKEEIEELETILNIIGYPIQHPLFGLYTRQYSVETKDALNKVLPRFAQAIQQEEACKSKVNELIGWQIEMNENSMSTFINILSALTNIPRFSSQILNFVSDAGNVEKAQQLIADGRLRNQMKEQLLNQCSKEFLNENAFALTKEWEAIQQKWFLPKFFASRKFVKKLRIYAPNLNEYDVTPLLKLFNDWQQKKQKLEEHSLSAVFTDIATINNEDWNAIEATLINSEEVLKNISHLSEVLSVEGSTLINRLLEKVGDQWTLFKSMHIGQLNSICQQLQNIMETYGSLMQIAEIDLGKENDSYPSLEQINTWMQNLDKLRDWQLWCTRKKQLEDEDLGFVIQHLQSGHVSPKVLANQVTKGIFHILAQHIIDTDEQLCQFNGLIFENQIEKYRFMAAEFQEITKKELYCKLASRIPSMSMEASASSEIGILKKNIHNGGRGTSIRKIMDLTPTLLPQLCPCMLMSPLSVAQYIDLDQSKFDLVIFDEASQMPTSEAVGAIARGKSLVVVGDPKQMPPTNFFSSNKTDEEEAYIDDLDSILDDCIALSMPSRYLTWHYRSKHESLIAFSNSQYYDGKLYTFPSVDDRASKVTYIPINGVYDKGRTRSNMAEAQAIVKEVLRRLSDLELAKFSIGIIAFSSVQQNLIEDLLTDALSSKPELEAKAYESEEPIFVKNLENVQGDERDIILFSIGYGPNKDGKVSMNFGPLNNKGGERRLNVAASRARYEMMIFSSLKSEQIDLKRTKAKGVEGLKKFLEFAERGNLSVPSSQSASIQGTGLLNDIANSLRKRGYTVDTNVGRSNFKVDVAVVSPKQPDQYILGILCDGANFVKTNTMRDREIVQPNVLHMLHWNIFRIWSVDWFENKETILDNIEAAINNYLTNEQELKKPAEDTPITTFKDELKNTVPVEVVNDKQKIYEFAHLQSLGGEYTIDDVLNNTDIVATQIAQLIAVEQPITNSLLYKRIVKAWNLSRVTPRLQTMVDNLLSPYYTDSYGLGKVKAYWRDQESSLGYSTYRINSERDVLDIPLVEIANAMLYTIEQQISVPREECKRLTSQILGFSHFGKNINLATEKALTVLLEEQRLSLNNDMVILP